MIRHIFIATLKENLDCEIKDEIFINMKALQKNIPVVVDLKVGFSTGWVGGNEEKIVLTVDFADKKDFEVYMKHPRHLELIEKAQTVYFEPASFVVAQFEF